MSSTSAQRSAGTSSRSAGPTVLIVGGGPGGIAAGIWAARLGLQARLLEARPQLGGQLLSVLSPITDYPGVQDVDGPALAARFIDHLGAVDVPITLDCRVEALDAEAGALRTADGQQLQADALIVATGTMRRRLGLPDEQRLVGHGVSYSVSKDRELVVGADAVIVGGGDSAVEGAARLAAGCRRVHLVHREGLTARPDFVAALQQHDNLEVHPGRQVVALQGQTDLETVVLDDGTALGCAGLFIRIGVEPATAFVRDELPRDDEGFLQVDAHQRCRGAVYAAGDVCSPGAMAVSVATGQAMIACKHIQSDWSATASAQAARAGRRSD